MEDILRKLPSPIWHKGQIYRLSLHKLKDKWLVSYETFPSNSQLVWKHNQKLRVALDLMLQWIMQNGHYQEEIVPESFKQLP